MEIAAVTYAPLLILLSSHPKTLAALTKNLENRKTAFETTKKDIEGPRGLNEVRLNHKSPVHGGFVSHLYYPLGASQVSKIAPKEMAGVEGHLRH